ncbi:AraC family transcriptional regulator [Flavobacteriaceae bacterium]|nr:AraC family transcriptional regulator [Flavobacteriaceae bacterium]
MAKRFLITKDLETLEFEAINEWGYAKHHHNFYELTFVMSGSGQHLLNDAIIDYKAGDIFFLTPKDEHEFVVSEPTKFGILKFTEQLFLEKSSFTSSTHWRKNLETVIFHSNIIAESIVHYKSDEEQLFSLFRLISNELKSPLAYSRNILTELFGALLIVLSRNLKRSVNSVSNKDLTDKDRVEAVLTYVRQHILDKEKLKIKNIATEFNLSANYVSIFIKKHIQISLQQYVIETKMNMAKQLLKQTNLNISQVAQKTGFVDTSHFNKTFKKYFGSNPSVFK